MVLIAVLFLFPAGFALAQEEPQANGVTPAQLHFIATHVKGSCTPQQEKELDCDQGQKCMQMQVECIQAPCPPFPECFTPDVLQGGGK